MLEKVILINSITRNSILSNKNLFHLLNAPLEAASVESVFKTPGADPPPKKDPKKKGFSGRALVKMSAN